ncbi:hypothetical protein B0A49_06315 [Cryomyces minteri]|uniref:Uncharacterized protein n=1 Tax=Cryomyces minteri TaxID=331657 RepID=A0A4U0X1R2_9PEZI|nr:hypothetical protein B0A49_06315 [Cryomyces minteri]
MGKNEGEGAVIEDYSDNPFWRSKRLSPAQVLVHDVRHEEWEKQPMLEIKERPSSTLVPSIGHSRVRMQRAIRTGEITSLAIEQQKLAALEEEYGWMNSLRVTDIQRKTSDPEGYSKCRWIHISSKFPDYLQGCLWAIADEATNPSTLLSYSRQLEQCIHQNERFSKHGKYFAPFFQQLLPESESSQSFSPILISVPFLDWSINGSTPPLRFQVDKREGYESGRTSSHLLRSLLQHFYRLEDTSDREKDQVFTRHKPWTSDRELDLKIRRWYGHYPTRLNVDELWILLVDPQHVVTFSSNQSWKARSPPLQLTSRISDVSFRGIRNSFFVSEGDREYTAMTHVVACLSGAVGILHRNFWTDMVLCLTDRYAGYLGHLQYRLHRSPSTNLVMDLLQVQEELNIIIQITQQQIDLITELQAFVKDTAMWEDSQSVRSYTEPAKQATAFLQPQDVVPPPRSYRATYRQLSTSNLPDPMAQLLENLHHELADLLDLRDNTNNLVNRTVQLVNIRLEDHGKAILVFTIVTIVFLPLSFVSSFFGMNVYDIRNMARGQGLFWTVAATVTVGVASIASFLAFYGGAIYERVVMWKEHRRGNVRRAQSEQKIQERRHTQKKEFKILGVYQQGNNYGR